MAKIIKKQQRIKARREHPEMQRLIAAINAERFPVYKTSNDFFKNAHTLKNYDVVKLHDFFNPQREQVFTYGFFAIGGFSVPIFLAELGFKVTIDDELIMWTAHIPKQMQIV